VADARLGLAKRHLRAAATGDWNRSEAVKALRKAIELDPDDAIAKADLAILMESMTAAKDMDQATTRPRPSLSIASS
jgi:Flp pilus assembly protein TadD